METKILNVILYRPGSGGNFLARLFSLSEEAQILWKRGTCGCLPTGITVEDKLRHYWYFPEKISNWIIDAHLTPVGFEMITDPFRHLWEEKTTMVTCMHPAHVAGYVADPRDKIFTNRPELVENYFTVDLSDELFTKMRTNARLPLEWPGDKTMSEITSLLTTKSINMDMLVNGGDDFLTEYKRVCELMSLTPVDSDIALSFYNNWKSFRLK